MPGGARATRRRRRRRSTQAARCRSRRRETASAVSGMSSSAKRRARATFSTWLSIAVYQPNPGVRSSAPIHQPKPITRHAAMPVHGSQRRQRAQPRPASTSARPIASGGSSAPSGSFASAARPKTARPAAQSPRRPSRIPIEAEREAAGERRDEQGFGPHVAAVGEEADAGEERHAGHHAAAQGRAAARRATPWLRPPRPRRQRGHGARRGLASAPPARRRAAMRT